MVTKTIDPDLEDWDTPQDKTSNNAESAAKTNQKEKAALTHPSHEELEKQLTELEQKLHTATDANMRLQAEIANLHRRKELDVQNTHKFAIEKLIQALLPVIDSLEKSLESPEMAEAEFAPQRQGIELTLKMFIDTLAKFGVKQISAIGQPFDPKFHEAISAQESKDHQPNIVIATLQKGYILHDRLLRPARVIVAK